MIRRPLPASRWLVALILSLLTLGLVPPPSSQAATTVTTAVTITSLEVTGNKPKSQVIVSGTITNNGAQAAFGVHLVLWRSRDPLREPAVLRSVAAGANTPWGERLNAKPENYATITDSVTSLDPGQSRPFTMRATLADLGFTSPGAVYVFGVQALGTPDASSNYATIGRARTFVTVPPPKPLPLTQLIVLASAPSKVGPGRFADEHLVGELSGRLDALLTLAERSGTSWVIDPALYDELSDMVDGYQVVEGDQTRPGTGGELAAAWLARFNLLPVAAGARTLFGNPDVLSAARSDQREVLTSSVAATSAVTALEDLPLVVLPYRGRVDDQLLTFVAGAHPAAVIGTTANPGPVLATGTTPVLRAMIPGAAGPAEEKGPIQQRERINAEAALTGGQVRLILEPGQADVGGVTPAWLRPRALRATLTSTPGPAPTAFTIPANAKLTAAGRWNLIDDLRDDYTTYAQLAPSSPIAGDASATLARLSSWGWLTASNPRAYGETVADLVGRPALADKVRLDVTPRFLMSAKSNLFPVTVTNGLSEPIQVKVVVSSSNPQRLTIDPSGVVTIDPGQSETVNVRPEATANGLVEVTAHVQTANGTRVTPNKTITVDVTDLGLIGWIIVITSGIVLVAATAWRIRQVRRQQDKEQA